MGKGDTKTDLLFGSFASAVGLALGELLLFAGRRQDLAECLAAIETTALGTLLASELEGRALCGPSRKSLASAAFGMVQVWHEGADYTVLGDTVEKLRKVLEEETGITYIPPPEEYE